MSKESMDQGFSEDYHEKNPFKLNRPLNIFNDDDIKLLHKLVKMLDPNDGYYNNISLHIQYDGKIIINSIVLPNFESELNLLDKLDIKLNTTKTQKKIHLFNWDTTIYTKERWDLEDEQEEKRLCIKETFEACPKDENYEKKIEIINAAKTKLEELKND